MTASLSESRFHSLSSTPRILAWAEEDAEAAQTLFSCLQLLPGQMEACLAAGLHSRFKLLSKISCGVPSLRRLPASKTDSILICLDCPASLACQALKRSGVL